MIFFKNVFSTWTNLFIYGTIPIDSDVRYKKEIGREAVGLYTILSAAIEIVAADHLKRAENWPGGLTV